MAARKKKSKSRPRRQQQDSAPQENRGAEAFTVFWMLTMMATLGAEAVAFAGWGLVALAEDSADEVPTALLAVPGLLLSIAVITGVLCLLLTPLAYRVRSTPPPMGVTVIAGVVGASPLLVLLLSALAQ